MKYQEYPKHIVIAGQTHIANSAEQEAIIRANHEPKSLPTAADLDAVAAEEQAKAATE